MLGALHARVRLVGNLGSSYETSLGKLDELLTQTDGVGVYANWRAHAVRVPIEPGLSVSIGSASDVILKEAAGGGRAYYGQPSCPRRPSPAAGSP